ncbi:MAG: class I SAM-dependent methyltransferase [Casimicrobiaceae bacterium]
MSRTLKVFEDYETSNPPPIDEQKRFWDGWNASTRFEGELDAFMSRQREMALLVAGEAGFKDARILDAGCGTGWLGNELLPFGRVWGTDLSPAAIAEGKRRHPGVELICGDFLEVDLKGPLDLVVMSDSLTHMHDQPGAVRRVAHLLRADGTYLLMTPNRDVWRRRSKLKPKGPGQIMAWPSLAAYRALLRDWFAIESVSTIMPGGDRGMLWWVENRRVRGAMGRLVGPERWRNILENAGYGRELVIVARRNNAPA